MTTKASTKRKRSRTRVAAKVEVNGKPTTALQIENLPIGKIKPDPKQPRKTFDEKQLQQLSDSIKEFGVLQPITVRKSGKNFTIVMGERRYRASKLAGKKTIPCIVRTYENNDVLEVQIIENLQRQDVEPTEEAEAISYLSDKYSPLEIAKRLGRTDNFIRQRLKLAGLIDGFKHFVRNGEMTISLGVGVALFTPEEQQMMLETMGDNFKAHQINRMINDQTYDLEKAPFDVADKKLVSKAGSCVECPFNAANQGNLFGEGKMVCTKSACFETKKTKSFLNLIEKSKKENILLIPEIRQYWANEEKNQLIISQFENNGLNVYLLDDVEIIESPIKPTMDAIKAEYQHYDYSEAELKAELEEAIQSYKEDLKKFNSAKDNGFVNGAVFHPETYQHKEIFVKVVEKSENDSTEYSEPLTSRKMVDCTPKEQIIKINEREIRKKQIENNKQFEEIVEMIRETKYVDKKNALSTDEMVAFSISLFENNVDYTGQQKYFSGLLNYTSKMTRVEMVEHFRKNFKKEIFYRLIRYILTKQVHFGESNHVNNLTNISFYNAMQGYYKSKISSIEKEYEEKRNKREARLKERIAVLEKKIQELND
ncbi:ParB/RepB/Spo0J family partition protein [Winogradskyella sp. SYSU M77433]|jgi:ParB family chromosome partitioning protein|uniref:ParB/RepB/Spo0J family partition protein n=1 Tax=Flavobacteriaceae TaxID=49546 RepID=UPI000C632F84|nr:MULTISPECIES: ParB/RepB/Spo0J family partition protein [Flavobacteriaceae]MAW80569.1 partitioning protein [Parvularcula sp.]MDH7912042.1 ParB/RepB/Spo0J family partition protein [Winogradskyella sp. SYSU M77433]|tara:strand:+ start:22 stop:1809 length:1788 start_codon:yes stop_codon:yes gene_type:complete